MDVSYNFINAVLLINSLSNIRYHNLILIKLLIL